MKITTLCIPITFIQVHKVGNYLSGGRDSAVLQKANVTITSNEDCRKLYPASPRETRDGIVDAMMICAGDTKRDSCQVNMP